MGKKRCCEAAAPPLPCLLLTSAAPPPASPALASLRYRPPEIYICFNANIGKHWAFLKPFCFVLFEAPLPPIVSLSSVLMAGSRDRGPKSLQMKDSLPQRGSSCVVVLFCFVFLPVLTVPQPSVWPCSLWIIVSLFFLGAWVCKTRGASLFTFHFPDGKLRFPLHSNFLKKPEEVYVKINPLK